MNQPRHTFFLGALAATSLAVLGCEDSTKRAQKKADEARITAGEVAREGQQDVDKKAAEANERIRKANEEAMGAQRSVDDTFVNSTADYRSKIDSRIAELEKEVTRLRDENAKRLNEGKRVYDDSLVKAETKLANLKRDAKELGLQTKESWTTFKMRVDEDLK